MSKTFRPLGWLLRWEQVGTVTIMDGQRVWLGMDIDGNMIAQRSLLSMLDAKPGRRDAVRKLVLKRAEDQHKKENSVAFPLDG